MIRKTAAIPEAWNDGKDVEFTYQDAVYEFNILCKLTPFVQYHLNNNGTYWNKRGVGSIVQALDIT